MAGQGVTTRSPAVHSVNAANRWLAIIIPLFLVGSIGYELYLVVGHVLITTALRLPLASPSPMSSSQLSSSSTFARLFFTIYTNPGVIPRGPEYARYYHGSSRMRYRDRKRTQLAAARTEIDRRLDRRLARRQRRQDLEAGLGSQNPPPSTPYGTTAAPTTRSYHGSEPRLDPDSPGLELFYTKDVFEVHARRTADLVQRVRHVEARPDTPLLGTQRCVRKMDHFCPWVGGIISETTFKFFVQFNLYATILPAFTLAISAYGLSERSRRNLPTDARIVVGLVLSAVLGTFAGSMLASCSYFVFRNTTSVEVHQTHRVKMLAVRIRRGAPPVEGLYNVVTYPLPKDEPPPIGGGGGATAAGAGTTPSATTTTTSPATALNTTPSDLENGSVPLEIQLQQQKLQQSGLSLSANGSVVVAGSGELDQTQDQPDPFQVARAARAAKREAQAQDRDQLACRTFAIVALQQGMNVWDLGWRRNFLSIMGHNPLDWLLPLRLSPICHRESTHSRYPLGRDFTRLCADYQLPLVSEKEQSPWG